MFRNLSLAIVALLGLLSPVVGQEWASKMFEVRAHDFGTVARGAKTQYEFEITNLYEEDIHIAAVRSSCGCTTPSITKPLLKTWEKGSILAVFNTGSFLGQRNATVTVTIDKPFFAEVQLRISGYIRSDVVFNPSFIDLGNFDQGTPIEKRVAVAYSGRNTWTIKDVRSANAAFEVELDNPQREPGRVVYNMTVRLKPDAPAGYIRDELALITDDSSGGSIPLLVEGRSVAPITVSPASLSLGDLTPGQKITKQIVVHGKKPFTINSIKSSVDGFEFKQPEDAKTTHVIPFTYTAGDKPGKLAATISIETNLGGGSLLANGAVKEAEKQAIVGKSTTK